MLWQIPEEVYSVFPEHYRGINLVFWIIFTVELFVFGILFIKKLQGLENGVQKKIEHGHAQFMIYYAICRVFFILMIYINDAQDYDFYCTIAYFWGTLGFTSLVYSLEKYALQRKPILSMFGYGGVIFSIVGIIFTQVREIVLITVMLVSVLMMCVILFIYIFLIKNTSGELRKRTVLTVIAMILLAVAITADGQFVLANPAVPVFVKNIVVPVIAIISVLLFYISRRAI
jgi:hypothetical protein